MVDERARRLANLVLDCSVGLGNGDKLLLQYDPRHSEYAALFCEGAESRGAQVRLDSLTEDPEYIAELLHTGPGDEWKNELQRRIKLSRWCNSRVLIETSEAPTNSDFDSKVRGPYKKVLYRPGNHGGFDVKWVIVGFPSQEKAQDAGMSYEYYETLVYDSTTGVDWETEQRKMNEIKRRFDAGSEVRLFVPDQTDLRFSISGRGGCSCDGHLNMPDGEVFYGPVEDSAEGHIQFNMPTKRGRTVLEGIRLKFERGLVSEAQARLGGEVLAEYLNIDEGTRRIGEFGVGCNPQIKSPTLDTLFDEKIGGTIHLALGSSCLTDLSAGGGLVPKELPHWDIVNDMRTGGKIYLDGRIVQENGIWVFK
jgi:aminopeptidase